MKRILIVDDHEENLYLLRVMLEGNGYEVQQAANGSEALAKALEGKQDLIISDILMPVMDGFTLCRALKADERLKHVPLIFYTATYRDAKDEKLALDMGANAFIVKPSEPDEFMRRVEEILAANHEGKLNASQKQTAGDEIILKEYNEVLINKLEQKMLSLEQANKALEAEITAGKQVEEALRKSQLITENIPTGLYIYHLEDISDDRTLRMVYANPAVKDLTGVGPEDVVGKTLDENFPGLRAQGIPQRYAEVVRDQSARTFEDVTYGDDRVPLASFAVKAFPLPGNSVGIAFENITERKRAEVALQESEGKFRHFFEASYVGKSMTLPDGHINANRALADMLGYSVEELAGKTWQEITPSADIEMIWRTIKPLLDGVSDSSRFDKRYLHKNGSIVWADVSTTMKRDANGKPEYLMTTVVDITERKQAEEEIRLNEARLRSLVNIQQYQANSIQELLDFALEESLKLTGSKIGYIYFYDENIQEFTLNTWSREVMGQCTIAEPQTQYELEKTGLWGEAVRQRKPIILNDYQPPHPWKKGYPEGHAPLSRFMTIPVFYDQQIVAVVGQGNKAAPYQETDVLQLTLLLDSVWKVVERKRAEEALRESEEKYRLIFETVDETIYIAQDGLIKLGNHNTETLTGFTLAELMAKPFVSLIHPDDRQLVIEKHMARLRGELPKAGRYEFRIIHKSGETRTVQLSTSRITWEGKPATINFLNDITERKRAEETLRQREALLNKIFDVLPVGLWLADKNGKLTRSNAKGREIWGAEPLVGQEQYGVFKARFLPSGKELAPQDWALAHTIQEGVTVMDEELEIDAFDGTKKIILNYTAPILDHTGKIDGAVIVNLDITDRKRVEEALRRNEQDLRKSQRIAHVGSWRLDVATNEVLWTEELYKMYGFDPSLPPPPYTEHMKLFTPESWERLSTALARTRDTGIPYTLELETVRKDGSSGWMWVQGEADVDSAGKTVGLWGAAQDITERKRAEEAVNQLNAELEQRVEARTKELQDSQLALLNVVDDLNRKSKDLEAAVEQMAAANKELEAFSYSVSHDLRAPLRAVNGYVQILLEDFGPLLDDEGKRVCAVISESARNMGRLIDDLLAFSRIGRQAMQFSTLDMKGIANTAFYQLTTPESRARIDFCVRNLPPASGDLSLIRQVWSNLLDNAIKFSSRKKRALIEVDAEQQGNEIVYSIRDNGAGFDMKYADKLFGVFQRLHGAREFAGTGVGLAIIQRIVLRHGGRIWAEGETDKGATFHFSLKRGEES